MPIILTLGALAAFLSIPFLTGQTFGQRCATAFEPGSAKYEKCIQRLQDGGSVHFEIRKEMVAVD